METSEERHLKYKHPFSMMVSGPTGSGKTIFVFDLLTHLPQLVTGLHSAKVLYCYGAWQERFTQAPAGVEFHDGFPSDYLDRSADLIVLDDLMEELSKDKNLTALFTKTSHHSNISVIFVTQNLFFQSKEMRTISLNCHYIVLLKNPRDRQQTGYEVYTLL